MGISRRLSCAKAHDIIMSGEIIYQEKIDEFIRRD